MACGILLEIVLVLGRLLPAPLRRWLLERIPVPIQLRLARRLMRWPRRLGWPSAWRPTWPAGWWSTTDTASRVIDIPGGRRVRDHGRWVTAEVTDVADPPALRQRNLDAVLEVIAGAAVPYFCLPSSDTRTLVGVRTPRPEDLLRLLDQAPELSAARVEAIQTPVGGLVGVRVYHAVTDPAGEWTLGLDHACEIEFWRRQGDRLVGPRANPSGTTLPAEDPTVVAPSWVLSDYVPVSAEAPRVRTRAALARIPMDRVTFAIDAVYTWVDGDDPRWQERMSAARDAHQGLHEGAIGPERFADRGELRHSLRSLAYFAPWLRRIYLVTDDQVPAWLDTAHPRVTVVSHREVFGEAGRLPTFNSHAVESRLHHIPGLAEHFLYLHDDMFLGRTLPPTAFFHANGVAKFFASPVGFGLGQATAATGLDVAAGRNGAEMIAQRYGRTITTGTVQAPYPCQRSVLEEIESNSAARMEATASHRFRDRGDLGVLSSMQHHWAFMQARAVPGQIQREYVDTARPIAAVQLSRLLRRRDADVFCLDDTGGDGPQRDEQRAMLGDFLAAYFPFRAPWERVAERVTEVVTPSARRPAPEEERPEREPPEEEQAVEPDEEPAGQASFAQRMISPLTRSGASWWRKWPAVGTRRHS